MMLTIEVSTVREGGTSYHWIFGIGTHVQVGSQLHIHKGMSAVDHLCQPDHLLGSGNLVHPILGSHEMLVQGSTLGTAETIIGVGRHLSLTLHVGKSCGTLSTTSFCRGIYLVGAQRRRNGIGTQLLTHTQQESSLTRCYLFLGEQSGIVVHRPLETIQSIAVDNGSLG